MPYMQKFYNILDFSTGTGFSGIARMIHPLVQALNKNNHLPKYILLMPDRDILIELRKEKHKCGIGYGVNAPLPNQANRYLHR